MGILGLESFMENFSNVTYQVDIKVLVEKHSRSGAGREPVIVVDGSSCLRKIYGDLDWVCGGQIKEFAENFKDFINAFRSLSIDLVFFFDGPTQEKKRKKWTERRKQNLNHVYKTFNAIARNRPVISNQVILPPAISAVSSYVIRLLGCKVYRSIRECDQEVAEYAMQHQCMAILAQDSDYVIYNGCEYYLSVKHLNIENMTTKNYDRRALSRNLNLHPDLLPLFATLVGNDIISANDLLDFHRRISNSTFSPKNMWQIISNVATFIRSYIDHRDPISSLLDTTIYVFGNDQRYSDLRHSIETYDIKSLPDNEPKKTNQCESKQNVWTQIMKVAEDRVKDGDVDIMVFAIMSGLPYQSSTGMEDFRQMTLPSAATLYLPFRQRIYGIILHEKPGDESTLIVQEWCMQGMESLEEANHVPVISSKSDVHPGLLTLWNEEDNSPELLGKKWKLMADAVSSKLDSDILPTISPNLLVPTLLLYYLQHELTNPFLKTWEIAAFIATAVMLPTYSIAQLKELNIRTIDSRAVQLASIFLRGYTLMYILVDACGRPVARDEVLALHSFDGKLFQTIYQKAKSGCKSIDLCNHQVSSLENFNHLKSIILP